ISSLWVLLLTGAARADVLYDNLRVSVSGHLIPVANSIGGFAIWGGNYDLQSVDDFDVAKGPYRIDTVTFDFSFVNGIIAPAPSRAVVEIFPSAGQGPSEIPVFSATLDVNSTGILDQQSWRRLTADLGLDGPILPTGTYYVSMQSIDPS